MRDLHATFLTYTGRRLTRTDGYLSLVDVAVALGRVCRYGGASTVFWPVLLHSLVVADLVPFRLEAHGLLDDMTDALFGDIPKPFKLPAMLALQHEMHARLLTGFQLAPLDEVDQAIVKVADVRAFVGEKRLLAPPGMSDLLCGVSDPEAEALTEKYLRRYPLSADVLCPEGRAVYDFIDRTQQAIERINGRP